MPLVGLIVLGIFLVVPLLAIVAFLRTTSLRAEVASLQQQLRELEARLDIVARHKAPPPPAAVAPPAVAVAPAGTAPPPPTEPEIPPPAPFVSVAPARPIPRVSTAPDAAVKVPAAAPAPPAAAPAEAAPPPSPAVSPAPLTPPVPSMPESVGPPAPPSPSPIPAPAIVPEKAPSVSSIAPPTPPAVKVASPTPAAAPAPKAPVALPPVTVPASPLPKPTEPPPPTPVRPPAPPPPAKPAGPPFDWEGLLGVKGAAIVGAVAVVIAGILFAKLAIDSGFFTPELRIALILASGVGALVWAEVSMRRGYEVTANAVSGAGISLLYAGLFAGGGIYKLIPTAPTFGLMALVTVVACLISIRYDAFFTAVLGLLGGFATPVALSTGEDRPLALFSYIFMLNLGLLAVARKKSWHGLVVLTVAATFLIQMGWFIRFFSDANLFTALAVFLAFGMLYLALPMTMSAASGDKSPVDQSSMVGGLLPLFFAVVIANHPRYAGQWSLFPFVFLMTLGVLVTARRRAWGGVILVTVFATFLVQLGWLTRFFQTGNLLVALPVFVVFGLLFLLLPAVEGRESRGKGGATDLAGMAGGLIPLLFGCLVVLNPHYSGHWSLFVFLFFMTLGGLLMARRRAWSNVILIATVLTFLVQLGWLTRFFQTGNLFLALLIFVAFGLLFLLFPMTDSEDGGLEQGAVDLAGRAGGLIPLFFGCLVVFNPHYDGHWALFLFVFFMTLGGLLMARRRSWSNAALMAIVLTFLVQLGWLTRFLSVDNLFVGLVVFLAFGLLFLLLPPAGAGESTDTRRPADLASMSGGLIPLFFGCVVVVNAHYQGHWALFAFAFVMTGGLLFIARRKSWGVPVAAAVALTFVIQMGWFVRFLSPENLMLGLGVFLVFGFLYLFLPPTPSDGPKLVDAAATVGALVPLFFGFLVGGDSHLAADWPLLLGYLAILDVALLVVTLWRSRPVLILTASLGTGLTLPVWAGHGLSVETLWGPVLAAATLTLLLNCGARLARAFGRTISAVALEASGLIAGSGLGLFALVLVGKDLGRPAGPFLLLLAAVGLVLIERSGSARVAGAFAVGSVATAAIVQIWFFASTNADTLLPHLAVPLLLAIGLSILTGVRAVWGSTDAVEDETAVLGGVAASFCGLLGCLSQTALGREPLPIFAAQAVVVILLVISNIRQDWTPLLPSALAGSWVVALVWHSQYFHPGDAAVVFQVYAVFYVAFLALPFASRGSLLAAWKQSPAPWFTSAFSGPLFFVLLEDAASQGWGKAWIGVLPLTMAGLTVASLAATSRIFVVRSSRDALGAKLRLRYLALFATIALGFVAVAIPLQLDRQWITVGWALEAAAVFWLFGRLPHGALKIVGGVLFAAVGARLLLNFENVMRYETGGMPILNWLLYTYGVPAVSCLVGASWLRRAEVQHKSPTRLSDAVALLGLLLIFTVINLEISHFFKGERGYARDLTTSVAWGLYGIVLLVVGVFRKVPPLRYMSLAFLILTVAKVFLYDLSALVGFYRILSFLGLGTSLMLVSLFYQRFVFRKEEKP